MSFFTVYGVENHAVMAMIARAFIGQDPFEVWVSTSRTASKTRVASNELAKRLLSWEPQMTFIDGLHRTIDWYFATKKRDVVSAYLARMLTERGESPVPSGSRAVAARG